MLVMPVDIDPSGPLCLLVVGITADDCAVTEAEANGTFPMIDIVEILYRLSFHKPVGAVQIVYGQSNAAIQAQISEALPGHDILSAGNTVEDVEDQHDRNAAMHEARRQALVARIGDRDDKAAAKAVRTNDPGMN